MISEEVEIEIQRHVNELRSEVLAGREAHIKHWVFIIITGFTSLGIVAGIIGYIEITRVQETKDKIEKIEERAKGIEITLAEAKKYLGKFEGIKTEAEKSAQRAAIHAETFDQWLRDIKEKRRESALVRGTNAKTADDDLKMVERNIVNVYENPEASTIDKAIAKALSFQRQGKRDRAIAEWHDIAYIAGKSNDNVLAATAQFSIGYLQAKKKNWKDAISAYEETIRLKPDFAEARKNLEAAKAASEQNVDY